ncbi:MAG TPA: tetratricopeptide repeat protein, partial [Candidatus Acidoferrum sp.]|nr:tetratricopeptide repeat protein [Candidatus Acidoferrum sp.]
RLKRELDSARSSGSIALAGDSGAAGQPAFPSAASSAGSSVSSGASVAAPPGARQDLSAASGSQVAASASAGPASPEAGQRARSKTWLWAGVAAAVLLAATASSLVFTRRTSALSEKDSILLTEFVNTTGDAVFDGTLKQALASQLEQSPFLNIVPESKIQKALQFMGRPSDERITSEVGREICQRENVKAMMTGSIASLGAHYVVQLKAVNGQTGDAIATEQVEVESKEQVLKGMDRAATQIRQKLGESLTTVQQFATPLEQATTSSLEALKAYSAGHADHSKLDDHGAIPFFQKAVEIDPNFALAWAELGVALGNEGMNEAAGVALKKALALEERASEVERFYITGHYFDSIGDVDQSVEVYEKWRKAYPRDSIPLNNLALFYSSLGRFEEQLAAALDEMRVDPNSVFSYQDVADAYFNLNRLDEARTIAEQGLAKVPDAIGLHRQLMDLAYLRGDTAEVDRHLAWGKGRPEESFVLLAKGLYTFNAGKRKSALAAFQDGQLASQKFNNLEFSAKLAAVSCFTASLVGDCPAAKAAASTSLEQFPGGANIEQASTGLALCGDTARALQAIDARVKQYPKDTFLNIIRKPAVLAVASLRAGKPDEAFAFLEPARRMELGVGQGAAPGLVIYLRGLAYLSKKDGANAALEFHKIVDRRYLFASAPVFALARLGLARAYVLENDSAKARAAYQDFLAAWKEADPDLAPLQQAKAEYAKLQ